MGLYTYMIISRRKSNLVGRMPVQIKGKESNDFSKDSITFSIEDSRFEKLSKR